MRSIPGNPTQESRTNILSCGGLFSSHLRVVRLVRYSDSTCRADMRVHVSVPLCASFPKHGCAQEKVPAIASLDLLSLLSHQCLGPPLHWSFRGETQDGRRVSSFTLTAHHFFSRLRDRGEGWFRYGTVRSHKREEIYFGDLLILPSPPPRAPGRHKRYAGVGTHPSPVDTHYPSSSSSLLCEKVPWPFRRAQIPTTFTIPYPSLLCPPVPRYRILPCRYGYRAWSSLDLLISPNP